MADQKPAEAKKSETVECVVRRGRTVDHNDGHYGPGQSFSATPAERDRLVSLGAIEGGLDLPVNGIGPAYDRDDEKRLTVG